LIEHVLQLKEHTVRAYGGKRSDEVTPFLFYLIYFFSLLGGITILEIMFYKNSEIIEIDLTQRWA